VALAFLALDEVLDLHRELVETYGGSHGVRDLRLLQSALATPQAGMGGVYFHSDVYEMAAAYLFHIVKNHPFVDGNKRTALVATGIFLENNGHTLVFRPAAADNFLRRLAARSLPFTEVARWVEAHCVPLRRATGAARGGGPRRRPAARAGRRRAARSGSAA
jgi:death-on-curing protein